MNDALPARAHLTFIDGLRGIAALIVAVGHTIGMVGPDHPGGPFWEADAEHMLMWPWLFGEKMVWLFILLSGFALYWSEEARRLAGRASTPFKAYVSRRTWRILPTYYVALAFGFFVVVLAGPLLLAPSPSLSTYAPVDAGGVLSHLFLVHNLSDAWVHQINPPLWSIAVEMQLYVLFPLLFVLRKRLSVYGAAALLVVGAFALGAVTSLPLFALIEWFAVGAVLAHVARRRSFAPGPMFAAFALTAVVGLLRVPGIPGRVDQLLWVVSFAALVLALCNTSPGRWNVPTWGKVRWLGARSYSLYAIHFPVALLGWAIVGRLDLARPLSILAVVLLSVSASIALATLMYKTVEAPSMKRSRGKPAVSGNESRPRHAVTRR